MAEEMIGIEVEGLGVIEFPKSTPPAEIERMVAQMPRNKQDRSWGDWITGGGREGDVAKQNAALQRNNPAMDKSYGQLANDFRNAEVQTDAQGRQYSNGAASLAQGFTRGNADNALRAVGMDKWANKIEREDDIFTQAHPVGSAAYKALGSTMTTMAGGHLLGMAGAAAPASWLGKTALGAATGGGESAAWEHGRRGSTGSSIAWEGAKGAALGGVISGTLGGIEEFYNWLKTPKSLISGSPDEIVGQANRLSTQYKDASQQLYKAADNVGATYSQQSTDTIRRSLLGQLRRSETRGHDSVRSVLDYVNKEVLPGRKFGLQEMQDLSEFMGGEIRKSVRSGSDNEVRLLMKLRDTVDGLVKGTKPTMLVSGSPDALALWKDATKLWAGHKRIEEIGDMIEMIDIKGSGQFTQSGITNAAKTKAQQIVSNIIKHKDRRWSPAEVEMWKQLASTKHVSTGVRTLARLAPRGAVSIPSSFGLGGMVGGVIGGTLLPGMGAGPGALIGGAAVPLAGHLAARTIDNSTNRILGNILSSAIGGPGAVAAPYTAGIPLLQQIMAPGVSAGEAALSSRKKPYEGIQ